MQAFDPRIGVAAGVLGSDEDPALEIVNAGPIESGVKLLPVLAIAGALWLFFRGSKRQR